MTQRLFVCEYLSGGGLDDAGAAGMDALLAQGLAMRDAMLADLAGVPGVSVGVAVGGSVPLPSFGEPLAARAGERMVDFVTRMAAQHDRVWILAPESAGMLSALAAAAGPAVWVGCRADAIRMTSSKRATLAQLAVAGIATPRACEREARRWVVKPDDGAGAEQTRLHADRAAAEVDQAARAALGQDATLEPWVEGEALSLSLLCGDEAIELLSVNRQCIALGEDGEVRYQGVERHPEAAQLAQAGGLAALAEAIGRAVPGLRGYVGIDLVWNAEHGAVVIEINPRLTCAYVGLSAELGRNLAGECLALHREDAHVVAT